MDYTAGWLRSGGVGAVQGRAGHEDWEATRVHPARRVRGIFTGNRVAVDCDVSCGGMRRWRYRCCAQCLCELSATSFALIVKDGLSVVLHIEAEPAHSRLARWADNAANFPHR